MIELGGCADGYWFDLTRTLVAGDHPGSVHLDMEQAIRHTSQAVYKAYSSGCRIAGQLAQIGLDALSQAGFKNGIVHGLGHGVGFAYHEAFPAIGPGSTDEIKPHMATSMEPGIYIEGIGGMRIEENVLWKRDSITVLSDYHNRLTAWKE